MSPYGLSEKDKSTEKVIATIVGAVIWLFVKTWLAMALWNSFTLYELPQASYTHMLMVVLFLHMIYPGKKS